MAQRSPKHEPTPLHPRYVLPPLHPRQREVYEDPSRFKVVVCGRQFGKTALGATLCVAAALRGQKVWWVAPTYKLAEHGWNALVGLTGNIEGVRYQMRPVYKMTFPKMGGRTGTIQVMSADDPDSLRGATLDGVVFDEAAMAKSDAWPFLRPALAVRKGWAVFLSTPKGAGDWFHDLFLDAENLAGWTRWQIPSRESPYISEPEIAEARETMASLVFSQEFEAQFVSYTAGMFRVEWMQNRYRTQWSGEERILVLGEHAVPLGDCTVFHTVDLAWSLDEHADYTVCSTWAVTNKRHLVLLDMVRGHFEGPQIVPVLQQAHEMWGGHFVVERAARQLGIIEDVHRSGLPVREVRADKDKVARALPATARMEQGRVWLPNERDAAWVRVATQELLEFPAGRHDDFVDTLSYAVAEAAKRSRYEEHGFRSLEG